MKVPTLGLLASLLAVVYGQSSTDCPADLLATDDCAAIINPIACYNQMRWSARTLTCIEGTSDADRKKKVGKYG